MVKALSLNVFTDGSDKYGIPLVKRSRARGWIALLVLALTTHVEPSIAEKTKRPESKAKSLDEITDAWGQWMVSKYPAAGKVDFTDSIDYKRHNALDKYRQHQVTVGNGAITWGNAVGTTQTAAYTTYHHSWINNTCSLQTQVFESQVTFNSTKTWSVTNTMTLALAETISLGVPGDNSKANATVTISTSSTEGKSTSKPDTQIVRETISAVLQTRSESTIIVDIVGISAPWTFKKPLSGKVAIWFKHPVQVQGSPNARNLYFFPIQQVFNDVQANTLISINGYEITGTGVTAVASGYYDSGDSVTSNAATHEESLGNAMKLCQ